MRLREIMTQPVKTIRPDATLQGAAALMRALDTGSLPVCDGDRIVGILSERDIVLRGTAKGLDPMLAKVREVMSRDIVYAFDDQEVEEAASLMEQQRIRRLVVLDRDKHLVGFVSLADVTLNMRGRDLGGRVLDRVAERPGGPTLH